MIILLLFALLWKLSKVEISRCKVLVKAKSHEALADPKNPGYGPAMDWVTQCEEHVKSTQAQSEALESFALHLLKSALLVGAVAWSVRVIANSLLAASDAAGHAVVSAGLTTLVDGVDVVLWLVLVV